VNRSARGARDDDSAETLSRRPWDAVIVGTGIGGSTLGQALVGAGWQVAFVDKGRDLRAPESWHDWPEHNPDYGDSSRRLEVLRRSGRETEEYETDAGTRFVPTIGSGTGGSSALYGMVLERFFPSDFEPRANHRDEPDAAIADAWPIDYTDLRPWYRRAEELYGVRGGDDPLRPSGAAREPRQVGDAVVALEERLAVRGAHPYRLPLACADTDDCGACQGHLCPGDCKGDALSRCLRPALAQPNAALLSECRAVALRTEGSRVRAVVCEHRGRQLELTAPVVVLAAGALGTPRLLLASRTERFPDGVGNGADLVGRHLMRHGIDLWVLRRAPRLRAARDAKAIGFNDLYEHDGERLGTVQSYGLPTPLATLRSRSGMNPWRLLGPAAAAFWRRYGDRPILASILEDLPYPANRVSIARSGAPRLEYRPGRSEIRRRALMRRRLRPFLRGLGATRVPGGDPVEALGHVCGTCRFGTDSYTSVLDPFNRVWETDNLYVVDASCFPSSTGLNPALTIAANALRVAAHLCERGR
jgi:choline dehydrogenase-like flavoprotein